MVDTPLPPPGSLPLSRNELVARINASIADNNVQGISAEDVRSRLLELVDSTVMFIDVPENAVTSYQMRRELAARGLQDEVYAMLGDTDAVPRIQWDSGAPVAPHDPLAANIQATLGYNDAQMDALFLAAAAY